MMQCTGHKVYLRELYPSTLPNSKKSAKALKNDGLGPTTFLLGKSYFQVRSVDLWNPAPPGTYKTL